MQNATYLLCYELIMITELDKLIIIGLLETQIALSIFLDSSKNVGEEKWQQKISLTQLL